MTRVSWAKQVRFAVDCEEQSQRWAYAFWLLDRETCQSARCVVGSNQGDKTSINQSAAGWSSEANETVDDPKPRLSGDSCTL